MVTEIEESMKRRTYGEVDRGDAPIIGKLDPDKAGPAFGPEHLISFLDTDLGALNGLKENLARDLANIFKPEAKAEFDRLMFEKMEAKEV